MDDRLSAAQRTTLEALRRPAGGLPDFGGLGQEVEQYLIGVLDPLLDRWQAVNGRKAFRVAKYHLSGCELRRAKDTAQFAWSPAKAQGTMVHQMIQCWFFDPAAPPFVLWGRAAEMVKREDSSIGRWIGDLADGTRAEMRLRCESLTAQFIEVFPPPGASFRPVVEAKQIWQHRALTCECRVDVQLGFDDGDAGGVVFVELKTGALRPEHLVDMSHYALLRTLRVGVPPRLLMLFSVAEGRFLTAQVDPEANEVWAAAERLIGGVEAAVTLAEGREPEPSPSPLCRWCAVRPDCPAGQTYLEGKTR